MTSFKLTDDQRSRYERDGFVIVPNFLDEEETALLLEIAKADRRLMEEASDRKDAEGNISKLTLRNNLSEDIYSAIVRSERLVNSMERLLGGEVYHYHHKMMLKEPKIGGAWEWHQDYGYWYDNGCLFPLMASCMIAVDRASRENGCLQVLAGSHAMGRIEHGTTGDQTWADLERVEKAKQRLQLVYAELDPGSALFFHCNLLHRSDMNRSKNPRWTLICCYNAARNDPYKQHNHPCYSFLEKWPDSRIKEIGHRQAAALRD